MTNRCDNNGIKQYFVERSKLDELLYHEGIYWRQRAKSFWLTEGNTNSKFFHAATTKRKKINNINHLVDDEGTKVDNIDVLGQMVVDYFKNIFGGDINVEVQEEENARSVVTKEQNDKLISEIKFEEFSKAVK